MAARPENAAARNNLGWELQRAGRPDEAEAQYRAALARQPRYALAMNNLGNLLLATGNAQEALDWFQRARAAKATPQQCMHILGREVLPGLATMPKTTRSHR